MGIGRASGEKKIEEATRQAIENALTETKIDGAKGVIINVSGSEEMSLTDMNDAITSIQDVIDENANVIFGTIVDEELGDKIVATVIATGVNETF